jgi:hypothetical protein
VSDVSDRVRQSGAVGDFRGVSQRRLSGDSAAASVIADRQSFLQSATASASVGSGRYTDLRTQGTVIVRLYAYRADLAYQRFREMSVVLTRVWNTNKTATVKERRKVV